MAAPLLLSAAWEQPRCSKVQRMGSLWATAALQSRQPCWSGLRRHARGVPTRLASPCSSSSPSSSSYDGLQPREAHPPHAPAADPAQAQAPHSPDQLPAWIMRLPTAVMDTATSFAAALLLVWTVAFVIGRRQVLQAMASGVDATQRMLKGC